jgi:DNA-binding transcriptional MerR regulator
LSARVDAVSIPNRPAFRATEVCEIAGVPQFVLRGWEAEFPDLGVAKTPAGPRVYRKADVERVLHLKRLILVEGLTLAGVRRRLAEEADAAAGESDLTLPEPVAAGAAPGLDEGARASLGEIKRGLHWILDTLGGSPAAGFTLSADPEPVRAGKSKAKKK